MANWYYQNRDLGEERHACRVAGLALALLSELPQVADKPGYATEAHVIETASAAGMVLPGQYGFADPENVEQLDARLKVGRWLIEHANIGASENVKALVLLTIATDALDSLPVTGEARTPAA